MAPCLGTEIYISSTYPSSITNHLFFYFPSVIPSTGGHPSWFPMSSTAFNLACVSVPDLTGMIVKDKVIGRGSSADVWKGTYTQQRHIKVDVRCCMLIDASVTRNSCTHILLQVAVKIIRSSMLSDRTLAEKIIRVSLFPRRFSWTLLLSLTFSETLARGKIMEYSKTSQRGSIHRHIL